MINNKISSWQFSFFAFISFISPFAFIRNDMLNNNIADTVFSVFAAFVLSVLISLPINFINESFKDNIAVRIIYPVYFNFIITSDALLVTKMLTNTIIPEGNPAFISVLMLLVALYGAVKGVECLARSCTAISFFFIVGILFIGFASFQNFRKEEYIIPFVNGTTDFYNNSLYIFSLISFVPQFIILKESVKEKFRLKYILLTFSSALIASIFFLLVQYTLGYYALTQEYPFYTLSAVTNAMPLKRLDLIFTFIFIMAAILRMSLSFIASYKTAIRSDKSINKFLFFVPLIISVLILSLNENYMKEGDMYIIRLISLVLLSLVIPIIFIVYNKIKHRRRS